MTCVHSLWTTPDDVFILHGQGEESDDTWRLYVKCGRYVKIRPRILWDEPRSSDFVTCANAKKKAKAKPTPLSVVSGQWFVDGENTPPESIDAVIIDDREYKCAVVNGTLMIKYGVLREPILRYVDRVSRVILH